MSHAMDFAEIDDQHAELLPARTVLSLLHASTTGPHGEPGQGQMSKGQEAAATAFMVLFGYDPANASQFRYAFTDVGKPA